MMILIGHNDVQGCTKDAKLRYNEWLKYYINVYVYAYFAFSIIFKLMIILYKLFQSINCIINSSSTI